MENDKPCFFQIVVGDYLTERLRIPPMFMKHLSEDMSGSRTMKATIKGVAGSWSIKLRKTETNTCYFGDGWKKVMQDNLLEDKEFLVFTYQGNLCFYLQIFEKNGCERIHVPPASESDEEDIKQALCFSSQNPHFKICMKPYNVEKVYTLRIPRDFSEKYFSASGKKMILLENWKGEAWEITGVLNSGAYYLCGGWRGFVHDNQLKSGDLCIFELFGEDAMRMHRA